MLQTVSKTDWWRTPQAHRFSAPILGMEVPKELVLGDKTWSVGVELSGEWVEQLYVSTRPGAFTQSVFADRRLVRTPQRPGCSLTLFGAQLHDRSLTFSNLAISLPVALSVVDPMD